MITAEDLAYLEGVIERSKERRRGFFGERKTTRAEVAEIVLVAYAPALVAALKQQNTTQEKT